MYWKPLQSSEKRYFFPHLFGSTSRPTVLWLASSRYFDMSLWLDASSSGFSVEFWASPSSNTTDTT